VNIIPKATTLWISITKETC